MRSGIAYVIAFAVLFGVSTPLAKTLLNPLVPVTLAGVLYFGSGLVLLWYGVQRINRSPRKIAAASRGAICPRDTLI